MFPTIQEQVQSNKDLHISTQRELLAEFRCDELAKAALDVLNEQVRSVPRLVEEGLGGLMTGWRETIVGSSSPLYAIRSR